MTGRNEPIAQLGFCNALQKPKKQAASKSKAILFFSIPSATAEAMNHQDYTREENKYVACFISGPGSII